MKKISRGSIHALEFSCQSPLKFYERCRSCPQFSNQCPDLARGLEILKGKKKLQYNGGPLLDDHIHVDSFFCMAPVFYFEKTRVTCGHSGRCREEGLLITLLAGKKKLDSSHRTPLNIPTLGDSERSSKVINIEEKRRVSVV